MITVDFFERDCGFKITDDKIRKSLKITKESVKLYLVIFLSKILHRKENYKDVSDN